MTDSLDEHMDEILENMPDSYNTIEQEIEEECKRMRTFTIRKIVVHDTCDEKILKIIKPGEYVFTDSRYDHFFLEGVTVCSVVGKMVAESRR